MFSELPEALEPLAHLCNSRYFTYIIKYLFEFGDFGCEFENSGGLEQIPMNEQLNNVLKSLVDVISLAFSPPSVSKFRDFKTLDLGS